MKMQRNLREVSLLTAVSLKVFSFVIIFQVSITQSETLSSATGGTRGARPTIGPVQTFQPKRQKVRTRVRRPPISNEPELVPLEEGPPKFALSSDEDIQVCSVRFI